jgi:hypothetical protein
MLSSLRLLLWSKQQCAEVFQQRALRLQQRSDGRSRDVGLLYLRHQARLLVAHPADSIRFLSEERRHHGLVLLVHSVNLSTIQSMSDFPCIWYGMVWYGMVYALTHSLTY